MTNSRALTRRHYEQQVCDGLVSAEVVPFREIVPEGWKPEIGNCHENVDRWVEANPECAAVRGWVVNASYGPAMVGVTAHSVVKGPDGHLFDITPVCDERVRPGMLFVPHSGDEASFKELRTGIGMSFTCPPGLLDNMQPTSGDAEQNPFADWKP